MLYSDPADMTENVLDEAMGSVERWPGCAEILNLLDDHCRLAIASLARRTVSGPDVTTVFT